MPHALVVGGTGMLAGAAEALALEGWRVSHIARRAAAFAADRHGQAGFDADYHHSAAFTAALEAALRWGGPPALGIAWFRTLKLEAPRRMAAVVDGRLFQVLGSRTAQPGHPERLEKAAAVAAGLPKVRLRQVVLGFRVGPNGPRANTHAEISGGLLEAIRADRPFTVVGQVDPWPLADG